MLPLTKVFHQFTEVFCLIAFLLTVFLAVVVRSLQSSEEFCSLLSRRVGNYTFDRTLVHSLNSPRSFHILFHKRWCEYSLFSFSRHQHPKILILLSFAIPNCSGFALELLLVSVSGCWAPFCFRRFSWFSLRTLFPVFRFTWLPDPIGIAASFFLMIIPFGLKCTKFSAADLFSPSFEFPFHKIAIFWLQLLSSVFARTLTLRSLSLLFCSSPEGSGQKVLCSARFILPVTGNRRYSEFLFHPCLYICNSFRFLQHCCCFAFRLAPFGALLQLYTVCI